MPRDCGCLFGQACDECVAAERELTAWERSAPGTRKRLGWPDLTEEQRAENLEANLEDFTDAE